MNPLGVRAMYLGASTYRIHGTDAPWTIGQAVSKGCIRMYQRGRAGSLSARPRRHEGDGDVAAFQHDRRGPVGRGVAHLFRRSDR